jgi:thiol-disulfide isomerase/thioredoxin
MMFSRLMYFAALASCLAPSVFSVGEDSLLRVGDRPPALDFTCYKTNARPAWQNLEHRVVVIEFWATWCQPCIQNIPHINALIKTFAAQPVDFFAVTYENEGMVERFVKEHPIGAIIGLDNDFAMFRTFKAWGIPMAVIIDAKGKIAAVLHPNKLSEAVLNDVLTGTTPDVETARPWSDPVGAEKYFRSLLKKGTQGK